MLFKFLFSLLLIFIDHVLTKPIVVALGNTKCTLWHINNTRFEPIPTEEGSRVIKSYFAVKSKFPVFGTKALQLFESGRESYSDIFSDFPGLEVFSDDGTKYPRSFAILSLLDYFKRLVERNFPKDDINFLIAVPSYFSFIEKQFLYYACENLDMKLLGLINGLSSAILQHTSHLDIIPSKSEVFLDVGSSSATFAIAKYEQLPTGEISVDVTEITSKKVCGNVLDQIIENYFIKKIYEVYPKLDLQNKSFSRQIRHISRRAKEELTIYHIARINVNFFYDFFR